jgi:hypothetical protein
MSDGPWGDQSYGADVSPLPLEEKDNEEQAEATPHCPHDECAYCAYVESGK